jgi:hypothetical protein
LTYSNKIIDSAIKTIRNLIAVVGGNNPKAFANPQLLQRVVNIYNNTVHSAYLNKYIGELYNEGALEDNAFEENYISDTRLKPLKKYYRPSFSPKFNSWIIDLVLYKQTEKPIYFFIININTRYLVVYTLKNKTTNEIYATLIEFLKSYNFKNSSIYFCGDGEKGFLPLERKFKERNMSYPIHFFFKPPTSYYLQLTYSNKIIDSVIKTIRNLIAAVGGNNPKAFANPQLLQRVVNIYNNTVHSAYLNKYTPAQVQDNREIESFYIKECQRKLEEIDTRRIKAGYLSYEPNNILLVYVPLENILGVLTEKRRRNFNEIAKFVRYENGNCVVDLLHPFNRFSRISVPVFYTKYVAKDINEYIEKYKGLFIVQK